MGENYYGTITSCYSKGNVEITIQNDIHVLRARNVFA